MSLIGLINGPNINRLGRRNPAVYGRKSLPELQNELVSAAGRHKCELDHIQSNHEGVLVDWLHAREGEIEALIVNPASLTPYGRSLAQAISDFEIPTVLVHITPVLRSAPRNRVDLFADIADAVIAGCGTDGYHMALDYLAKALKD